MNIQRAEFWQPGVEGVFSNLPEEKYRGAPGVNVSSLKAMRLSPAHYKHALEDESEDRMTNALVIGTLVHAASLTPNACVYVVRPEKWDSWRTKEAKAWREAQSVPAVTPEEDEVIKRCAEALTEIQILKCMAAVGHCELSAFKRHPRTGLLLKGRADIVAYDECGNRWGLDIKTVIGGMASREAFCKRIGDMQYHKQDAFYRDLFGLDHFVFVAVEKQGFPGVGIYELEREDVELGRRSNEAALQRIAECQRSETWPGYPAEIRKIGLTGYKRKQEMEDVQ